MQIKSNWVRIVSTNCCITHFANGKHFKCKPQLRQTKTFSQAEFFVLFAAPPTCSIGSIEAHIFLDTLSSLQISAMNEASYIQNEQKC